MSLVLFNGCQLSHSQSYAKHSIVNALQQPTQPIQSHHVTMNDAANMGSQVHSVSGACATVQPIVCNRTWCTHMHSGAANGWYLAISCHPLHLWTVCCWGSAGWHGYCHCWQEHLAGLICRLCKPDCWGSTDWHGCLGWACPAHI